ncbi:TraR/DksA family transcriptional regulator [Streptomyces sp. NBC_00344]|uniref:TraR/DksA family transcriptional regulator n=1 Tax=Streptomyces sp. NBC_00344 TaxID=2975720 RepID=UPI003FA7637D
MENQSTSASDMPFRSAHSQGCPQPQAISAAVVSWRSPRAVHSTRKNPRRPGRKGGAGGGTVATNHCHGAGRNRASKGPHERCGEPIPAERLEARPAASTCVRCAAVRPR